MNNHHQKIPIYKILILFNVESPPQGMNLPLVLIILLKKILPVILPIFQMHDILLHIKIRVPLFPQLLLQNIC